MGRYITGDIEGKCWFAVQPSDFADRFGQTGTNNYLNYSYSKDDLETIEAELKAIENKLGDNLQKLDDFFNKNRGYTNDELNKLLETDDSTDIIRDYADYKFGIRLRDYLKENEYCYFDVEL